MNTQTCLILLAIFAITLWYLKHLWQWRKLYIYSWNVPGPLWLPFIGSAYKFFGSSENIADTLVNTVKQYPSPMKFWLGPHLVYCIYDPQQVEKVLTNSKCLEKDYLYKFIIKCIGTGLLTAPVLKWKKHRKAILPSFNQRILDSFVEVFAEQSAVFTEVLKGHVHKKEIDISELINAMMMDVICETAMGLKMNTQGGKSEFAIGLERIMELVMVRIFKIYYHLDWIWRRFPLSKDMDKCASVMHEVTSKVRRHMKISAHFTEACHESNWNVLRLILEKVIRNKLEVLEKEREHRRNSLVAQIEEGGSKKRLAFLDLIIENSIFTEGELRDEVEVFLIAGTDTSASTTCFCFEMLGLFPEVQQKVYEEAIDVLGEERLVEPSDLPKFKYLERVIKETLRLFPVAVYFVRIAGEDLDLGSHIIPEGASVLISSLNIHRNPKYWPDPLKFDPDRFLPEEVAKRHPCSYVPFSYGPRNCIGVRYAMMSLKAVIATTIRKYRVFTHYKSMEELEVKAKLLMRPKYGHKVYMERR